MRDSHATDDRSVQTGLAPVIAWFRFSEGRRVTKILLLGAPLVLVGDLLVALAVVLNGTGLPLQLVVLALGLLFTAAGPGIVIWKLRDLWSTDRYLALHVDGVRYQGGASAWFESWDDVSSIEVGTDGVPCLARHDGSHRKVPGQFAGTSARDLVETMRTVRRKALFGMYG